MLTCPWNTAPENMPCVRLVRLIAIDWTFCWGIPLATALPDGTTPRDPGAGSGPSAGVSRGGKARGLLIPAHGTGFLRAKWLQRSRSPTQNLGHVLLLLKTSCRITGDAVNTFVSWQLCDKHRIDTSLHQLSTHAAPDTVIGEPPHQACLGWHASHKFADCIHAHWVSLEPHTGDFGPVVIYCQIKGTVCSTKVWRALVTIELHGPDGTTAWLLSVWPQFGSKCPVSVISVPCFGFPFRPYYVINLPIVVHHPFKIAPP